MLIIKLSINMNFSFIMFISLLFPGCVHTSAVRADKRKENIRADFYNLDSVSKFEKIPDDVKLQLIKEDLMSSNNTELYAYAQRSGHSTTTHRCNTVDHHIPRHLTFITRYRFYSKYTHAYGIPVVAPSVVSDEAVKKACYIVRFLFADRHDIRENMYKYFGRVAIIGKNQRLTQIPEFSHLPDWWNQRARGLGGTLHIPVSCGGEENLLCLREDRYYGDDIFFHETAHAVAELAIRAGRNGDLDGLYSKLQRSYNNAKRKGLWRRTYAMNTVREYFAEGAQSFFNCHISVHPPNGIHNNIATRSQLKRYDPELYRVLEEVFPCKNKYYWCHRGTPPDPAMDCKDGGTTKPKPTQRPSQAPTGGVCVDKHASCPSWASDGYCTGDYSEYVAKNCRKSCKLCQIKTQGPSTQGPSTQGPSTQGPSTQGPTTQGPSTQGPTTVSACVDKHTSCPSWATDGYCSGDHEEYMKKNCRKSCSLCQIKTQGPSTQRQTTQGPSTQRQTTQEPTTVSACIDKHTSCPSWATDGYCSGDHEEYMRKNCRKSCKLCQIKTQGPSTQGPTTQGPSTQEATTQGPSTQGPTTQGPSTQGPSTVSACIDKHTSCPSWATDGYCSGDHEEYMRKNCRKSCSLCQIKTQGPSTQGPTTQGPSTQEATTQRTSTQEATTQRPSTQEATTQGPTTQEATTQGPTTQEATTQRTSTQEATTQGPSTQEATTQGPTTQEATTQGPTTQEATTQGPTTVSDCVDKNVNCKVWADGGYCAGDYKVYMSENCKKSCFCSSLEGNYAPIP